MKIYKSHFWYTKNQGNGIFVLVIIIFILQIIIFSKPFDKKEIVELNNPEIIAFQKQIDSLKTVEIENRKPKIYPFNPNYITDFKGEQLGMSLEEIDRLLSFRKTGKFINSKEEFQKVTKVSDSLLQKISPYFKFPDWVIARNKRLKNQRQTLKTNEVKKSSIETNAFSTNDINKATLQDLLLINDISDNLAERIIKYRSKLQGFTFNDQLYEVFNIRENQVKSILVKLKVLEKPIIEKVNINTIEFKQLLKIPYMDYELCKKIFDYRDEVAELQNISELKNIKGFPINKYDRIVLYLQVK